CLRGLLDAFAKVAVSFVEDAADLLRTRCEGFCRFIDAGSDLTISLFEDLLDFGRTRDECAGNFVDLTTKLGTRHRDTLGQTLVGFVVSVTDFGGANLEDTGSV